MKLLEKHVRTILDGNGSPIARSVVPIDIGPVATWYFEDAEVYELSLRDQFPSVVAPFPVTYFEYKVPPVWKIKDPRGGDGWVKIGTKHGPGDFFAALIVQDTLPDKFSGNDPAEGAVINNLLSKMGGGTRIKFKQFTFFFAGNGSDCISACWVINYLDDQGRMLGGPVHDVHPTLLKRAQPESEAYGDLLRGYGYPVYFALSLLTDPVNKLVQRGISDKDRKKAKAIKSIPFNYRDLVVDTLRESIRSGEHGTDNSVITAMRIAADHWKTKAQGDWWDDYVNVVPGTEKAVEDLKTFKLHFKRKAKVKKQIYPPFVCSDCAVAAGGKLRNSNATWHEGKCGVCGLTKTVTEPRDFGHPQFFITQ